MITHALQITVFVKDLDETKTFYTEKLGFIVCNDEEFEPGWRFLTVAPSKNNETVLELANANSPEQKALIGKQATGEALVMFTTDDIEKDYREMKARGVVFRSEPKSVPGGKGAAFEDVYGNLLDMYQKEQK